MWTSLGTSERVTMRMDCVDERKRTRQCGSRKGWKKITLEQQGERDKGFQWNMPSVIRSEKQEANRKLEKQEMEKRNRKKTGKKQETVKNKYRCTEENGKYRDNEKTLGIGKTR